MDEDIKLQLAELDHAIEMGNAVKALMIDPNFKKLYKLYTETNVLNLSYSLGSLDINTSNKDNVTRQLESIALFKNFVEGILQDYDMSVTARNNLLGNGE